jgi:hypothetical protein
MEFENYIFDCLYFYTRNFSVVRQKKIKEVYGSHITNINFLIMINENIFLIHSNFDKDRPNSNNIKSFITDCEYLKNKMKKSYNIHMIYLSRIAPINYSCIHIFLYDIPCEYLRFNENEYLLMRLYNYIAGVTNIRLGLKEYLSDDILMTYII